ncbi:MAG: N-6 DNA methylase [Candidatus Pacearchaeota archaeon]|nr:N-6 DNA methylase [Candidatus Pacearchaeota archaeon]
MDKENAKQEVEKIVKRFQEIPQNKIDSMPEEDIKFQFIEPLFESLGWKREEISKETRILKGRADYLMRIGNQYKLVVEAKKTSVRLSEEEGKQAVSYAHHKNIKFAVLTNFKQIKIYHALSNIKNIDKNLLKDGKGYLQLDCKDFIEQFDRLWLLSRESFEKEEINKLLENVDKRLIKPIDESILTDLLQYREWLSKDLKSKRNYLTEPQIDEVVQILIDRLIFMRSVEDRGLEEEDFLLKKINDVQQGRTDKNLWSLLLIQFKIFDKEYNSKLFSEGILEKEGFFDDKTLMKVIKGLYYGTQDNQERYRFDDLPVDLLGNIYEQYLGVVLRGTEKRVKLDLLSRKRKKMGIYYTPKYIVDYILDNTLVEYAKNKTLDEILDMKVIDPACGSGSFLLDAFEELKKIIEERLKNGESSKKWDSFKDFKGRLTLGQKATILLNCIYGVDLDEKAVELTQLNLLLKILEEETRETRRRILPNMKDNIKNGNSLISDSKFDKAFNWQAQFPDVFRNGGFDVVVGNPPYGAELRKEDKEYLKKRFKDDRTKNTASYFIFLGIELLKNNGNISLIVPKQLTYISSWEGTRELILKNNLRFLIDTSEAFEDVELEQVIFGVNKENKSSKEIIVGFSNKGIILEDKSNIKFFNNNRFPLWITDKNSSIFEKVLNNSVPLREIAKVNWGGMVAKYMTKTKSSDSISCIRGKEVQRYYFNSEYYIKKKDIIPSYHVKGEKLIFQRIVSRYGKKIISNYRNARIVGTYTNDDNYADKTVTLIWDSKINLKFLLGILNSKLINWFAHRYLWNRSQLTMEFMYEYARNFPILLPSETQAKKIKELVERIMQFYKEGKSEQDIKNVDYEIDQEVYKLYGLTKEEIKIIEESLG